MRLLSKRLLSLFMALAMVCSLAVAPARAADNTETEELKLKLIWKDKVYYEDYEESFYTLAISAENPNGDSFKANAMGFYVKFDPSLLNYEFYVEGDIPKAGRPAVSMNPVANAAAGDDYIGVAITTQAITNGKAVNHEIPNGTELVNLLFTVVDDAEKCNTQFGFTQGTQGTEKLPNVIQYVDENTKPVEYKLDESDTYTWLVPGELPTLDTVTFMSDDAKVTSVTVDGSKNQTIQAKAESIKTTDITKSVTWSVTPDAPLTSDDKSVTIDAATGEISVDAKAKTGTYTVTATPINEMSKGDPATAKLTVEREAQKATAIKIVEGENKTPQGESATAVIPVTGSNTYTYKGQLYDQFGDEMTGDVALTASDLTELDGVTFEDGVLTVPSTAKDAKGKTLTITASYIGVDSVTLDITFVDLDVKWDDDGVKVKDGPIVYGTMNKDIMELPAEGTGSALVGTTELKGTYEVLRGTDIQSAGKDMEVTVQFTVTTEDPDYNGVEITKVYKTDIEKKPIEVKAKDKPDVEYLSEIPELDYDMNPDDLGKAEDTLELTLKTEARTPDKAAAAKGSPCGEYDIVKDTCTSTNYDVTVTPGTLTIVPAKIIEIETAAPEANPILANDPKNTADGLKELLDLPTEVTVKVAGGPADLDVEWGEMTPAFDVKGGEYTFVGTPKLTGNFTNPDKKTLNATVTVERVTANVTLPKDNNHTSKTFSEVQAAENWSDLGLPATATVTYAVPTGFDKPADADAQIKDWTPNLAALKDRADAAQAGAVELTPVVDYPEWATVGTEGDKFTLTLAANALTDEMVTLDVPEEGLPYTGKEQTPAVTVKDLTTADYDVKYENNINVGTATVTVTGKNHYAGEVTKKFEITKASISELTPEISGEAKVGETLNAKLTGVADNEVEWTWTVDGVKADTNAASYVVKLEDSNKEIKVQAAAKENGNYTGTSKESEPVHIEKYAITGTVTISLVNDVDNNKLYDEGDTVKANVTGVPESIELAYYWNDSETATGDTYEIPEGAETVKVTVSPVDDNFGGKLESEPVVVGQIVLTGTVEITGDPAVGSELTAVVKLDGEIPEDAYTITWLRDGEKIGEGEKYTVTKEDQGKKISVKVSAVEDNEMYTGSVTSDELEIPANVPEAPEVTAEAGKGEVTVKWTKPYENGAPITGYKVSVGDDEPVLLGAAADSYTFTGLTNGTNYTFTVVAVNAAGDGKPGTASAMPASEPAAPIVTGTPGNGKVTINWTTPAANGASITGYRVSVVGGESRTVGAEVHSYTFEGLTNDRAYTFTVEAINSVGTGAAGSVVATPKNAPAPDMPNVSVNTGDRRITVTWNTPNDNGTSIVEYIVSATDESGDVRTVTVRAGVNSYTFTDLTNGTRYLISVAARNSEGTVGEAGTASATPEYYYIPYNPVVPSNPIKPPVIEYPVITEETLEDGTKVTTTQYEDGSTVTVTETPDGTKITENPDGTKITETPDGTKITENPDGTTITVTDTATTVELPADMIGSGVVNLPISNTSGNDTIVVNTEDGSSVKVAIPVSNANSGTVAVLVNADGSEQIIKTSVADGNSLIVTLNSGDAVKVINNGKSFADTNNHWASDAVAFVTAREMFNGTGDNSFSPDAAMTRGMLMTVLARFEGVDTNGGSVWYERGVAWAMAQGLSDGTNPDGEITREQLATIMYRYAQLKGVAGNVGGSLAGYNDAGNVSSWASEAMAWAIQAGLITGMDSVTLNPQGSATRAQVATILMRYVMTFAV